MQAICSICDLQIFSPNFYLYFNSLNRVFQKEEVLNFDGIQYINVSIIVILVSSKGLFLVLGPQMFSYIILEKFYSFVLVCF